MSIENPRVGGFLSSEAPGTRSRDQVTLLAINDGSTILQPGQVLGCLLADSVGTYTAGAGNTGNGACGAVTSSAGIMAGTYWGECYKAVANSGVFRFEDPNGLFIGDVIVGTPFVGGGLNFTLADGATDFIVGDKFKIVVAAGTLKWASWSPAGKQGREIAQGVLYASADVSGSNDVQATVITNSAEVKSGLLIWGTTDGPTIAAGTAQLALKGIKVRASA